MTPQAPKAAPVIDFSKPIGPVKWMLPQTQIVALYHPRRAQREGKK